MQRADIKIQYDNCRFYVNNRLKKCEFDYRKGVTKTISLLRFRQCCFLKILGNKNNTCDVPQLNAIRYAYRNDTDEKTAVIVKKIGFVPKRKKKSEILPPHIGKKSNHSEKSAHHSAKRT